MSMMGIVYSKNSPMVLQSAGNKVADQIQASQAPALQVSNTL